MSLLTLLREKTGFRKSTAATPAIPATDCASEYGGVAGIATIAVAKSQKPTSVAEEVPAEKVCSALFATANPAISATHDPNCPLCALVVLKRLQARSEANQAGRTGAIPRVHLYAWRSALRITPEAMHFLANDLHQRGAVIRENGYARLVEPDLSNDHTTGATPCH